MSRDELDVVAIQQDAILIHALATRSPDVVDHADPVVRALASWVDYVDAGVDDSAPFVLSGAKEPVVPQAGRARRALLIAGSTTLALVVSGGAAAAVTGDPMAMVKAPLQALGTVNPFNDDHTDAHEQLPQQAPARAQANKLLAGARRAMAQGHPLKARRLVAEAKTLVGDDVSPGQLKLIDSLDGQLPDRPVQAGGPGDHGPDAEPGAKGSKGNKPGPDAEPGAKGSKGNKPGPDAEPGAKGSKGNKPGPEVPVGDAGDKAGSKGSKGPKDSKDPKSSSGKATKGATASPSSSDPATPTATAEASE